MKNTILIVLLGVFLLGAVIGFSTYFSYQNQEVALAEQIHSKINVNKSAYTKMWEIIKTQAGVSEKYAEDFKEIYPDLIKGRYSQGQGQLMNWVVEHNPNFDSSLYSKLMTSIEAQRETFHTNQVQLQDLSRQHNTLLKQVPSKWFLFNKDSIPVPNVINDAAAEAFETERESEMNLFD